MTWKRFQLWFLLKWNRKMWKQVLKYNRQIERKTRARNEAAKMAANHRRIIKRLREEISHGKH